MGKDKGKQGIVNFIIKERNWCFVEGRHCVSIHKIIDSLDYLFMYSKLGRDTDTCFHVKNNPYWSKFS